MNYAGNGSQLVSFEQKSARDAFVKDHASWNAEKASDARDYPQFKAVKNNSGLVRNDDGTVNDFWTDQVFDY